MPAIERMIQEKAYELGYEKCGIIPIKLMEGYAEKLNERIQKVPQSKPFYQRQRRLANPLAEYPWAKSIVVMVVPYGKYKVPESVKGHIAKAYLFDVRVDPNTKEYQQSRAMEQYLQELGFQVATNQKFGLVGLRWAAFQAGLGIIRRNNFFYTQSGSWVHLEAWLIDREMELKETPDIPQCPERCNRCIKACPTCSLTEPYTMSPTACISFLTTFGGRNLPNEPLRKRFGDWIYGCDICQDVCPMNKGKWQEVAEFPGLAELAATLTPENILNMDEDFYREKIQPKFFYLSPDELWKWKVDVLCFMRNHYTESYKPYIINACKNQNEKIREMASLVYHELNNSDR
ncbi:MAG TPA: Fe-S oxidoreductase [Firmicutes bacterium]|nr:Fe-S oxidoreductase [Bacillota bacterium]